MCKRVCNRTAPQVAVLKQATPHATGNDLTPLLQTQNPCDKRLNGSRKAVRHAVSNTADDGIFTRATHKEWSDNNQSHNKP